MKTHIQAFHMEKYSLPPVRSLPANKADCKHGQLLAKWPRHHKREQNIMSF